MYNAHARVRGGSTKVKKSVPKYSKVRQNVQKVQKNLLISKKNCIFAA